MSENKKSDREYRTILMTVIALMAVLSGLGLIFNILIGPVKTDVAELKVDVAELKVDVAELKADVAIIKSAVLKK